MNLGRRGSESSSFSSIYNTFFGSSGSRGELSDWDKKRVVWGRQLHGVGLDAVCLLNGEKLSPIRGVESEKQHLHSCYGVRGIFRMRPHQIWGEGSQAIKGLEGRVGGTDKSH